MIDAAGDTLRNLLREPSFDLGWKLIHRFSVLDRRSGSLQERTAGQFIISRLKHLNLPHTVHEPDLFVSVPVKASVGLVGERGARIQGKPPSFSASTPARGLSAEAVHVPAKAKAENGDIFSPVVGSAPADVAGKVVITEGMPMPSSVKMFEEAGAVGQVYINPGAYSHYGICTPIWGTPSRDQLSQRPRTPVVAVSRMDGTALLEGIEGKKAPRINIHAELREKWCPCLVPVAHIDGESDDFLLVHGHYDSWDIGIGDNAVGCAMLLELARLFHGARGELRRSLRIAWWPGHSTGRYAGSTWYADEFALEIDRRCIGAVNIDSPGCWKATAYESVPWMSEADDVCRSAIRVVSDEEPGRERPPRAGDYSFNQLGVTSFFMLLSNIPREERERLGYYEVGGCGGNIKWHTEHDDISVADNENLIRDLKVYVAAIWRMLSEPVLPLDYRRALEELVSAFAKIAGAAADKKVKFDVSGVRKSLEALRRTLNKFYEAVEAGRIEEADANEAMKRTARALVPLGYAKGDKFRHDPAIPMGVFPRLQPIREFPALQDADAFEYPFLRTQMRRECNHVVFVLDGASKMLKNAMKKKKKA